MRFKAEVVSGLGKGRIFLSIDEYAQRIRSVTGFHPFPGTLNLKVRKEGVRKIIREKGKFIEGFNKGGRSYGGFWLLRSKVNGQECFLILPERTRHGEDVIEVIAGECLREKLGLKDGDLVEVEI